MLRKISPLFLVEEEFEASSGLSFKESPLRSLFSPNIS
jgi:hypothetical protein